jgi:hypothetical protein
VEKGCAHLYESKIQPMMVSTLRILVPQDKMEQAPKRMRWPLRYAAQLPFITTYIPSVVLEAFSYSA